MSTGTCIAQFLDTVYPVVDQGGACGMPFLDLAKAFDTVSHEVLLWKLKNLGFKSSTVNWYRSYLSDRSQVTTVDDATSSVRQINCGAPQDSILGPLLFICYINDLSRNCINCITFVYADDTALLVHGNDKNDIEWKLEADLCHLSGWFKQNKLCLNSSKTNCMLMSGKCSAHRNESLSVHLEGEKIDNVQVMKYLGLQIDYHLTFESHINAVCGKIAARTGLLWRIRNFIPMNVAMTLYTSLIYPHLLYANFALDGTTNNLKNRLQVQQNNGLRAVLKRDYLYSSVQLYVEAKTDRVTASMKKSLCNIV